MKKINNKNFNLIKKLQNVNLLDIGNAEENVKVKITIPILELLGFDKVLDMDFEKNVQNKKADIAIISCGAGNSYGHPHDETVTALSDISAEIYGTEVYGNIMITTDGETFTIITEKL